MLSIILTEWFGFQAENASVLTGRRNPVDPEYSPYTGNRVHDRTDL